MNVLVSVVIPNYNHEKFLEQRIYSVLNQSFQDFEIIILDDCSSDNSHKIIESYRGHPKVRHIVYNNINSGSTFYQWNKAILEISRGKFIWIAESDDIAQLDFLEKLIPILEKNQDIKIAYCQSAKMNHLGEITGSWLEQTSSFENYSLFHQSFSMSGEEYIENFLFYKNTIPNASAVVFRKDSFIQAGGAQVQLKTNGDWDLWFKILLQGNIYYCSDLLNNFRYHDSSVIAKAKNNQTNRRVQKHDLLQYDLMLRKSLEKEMSKLCLDKSLIFLMNKKIKNRLIKKIFYVKLKIFLMKIWG